MARKTQLLASLAAKALVVAVAAGGVLLVGGVANADTPGNTQTTGTGGLLGGTGDIGHLVGSILDPILGGQNGSTGLVNQVVKPILGQSGKLGLTINLDLGKGTGTTTGGQGS